MNTIKGTLDKRKSIQVSVDLEGMGPLFPAVVQTSLDQCGAVSTRLVCSFWGGDSDSPEQIHC